MPKNYLIGFFLAMACEQALLSLQQRLPNRELSRGLYLLLLKNENRNVCPDSLKEIEKIVQIDESTKRMKATSLESVQLSAVQRC